MKLIAVTSCLVALAVAAPKVDPELTAIRALPAVEHEEIHDERGQYTLHYVTAEGTVVSEKGRLVPTAKGGYVLVVDGEVTFKSDDGKMYTTKYSAGLDGVRMSGEHLPVPVAPETAPVAPEVIKVDVDH